MRLCAGLCSLLDGRYAVLSLLILMGAATYVFGTDGDFDRFMTFNRAFESAGFNRELLIFRTGVASAFAYE